jgi:hypothetical protein
MMIVGDGSGVHRARGTPSLSVVNGPEQLPPKNVVLPMSLEVVDFSYSNELCLYKKSAELPAYEPHNLSQQSIDEPIGEKPVGGEVTPPGFSVGANGTHQRLNINGIPAVVNSNIGTLG